MVLHCSECCFSWARLRHPSSLPSACTRSSDGLTQPKHELAGCVAISLASSGPTDGASEGYKSHSILAQAIAEYRALGIQTLSRTPVDAALWATACDFINALLEGVCRHIPSAEMAFEMKALSGECLGFDTPLLRSFEVSISPANVLGEFATKSRLPVHLRLAGQVRFSPRFETLSQGRGLTLDVDGLTSQAYDDAVLMRTRIEQEFGEDFTRSQAYQWWQKHKDALFPVQKSKLRRLVESLTGSALGSFVPPSAKATLIFANAQSRTRRIESFMFRKEGSCGIRIIARQSAPCTDKEAKLDANCLMLALESWNLYAPLLERFATSSVNWTMMCFEFHHKGAVGADPQKIIKLFSGASSWGPGPSGWTQFDQTGLCEDKKGVLGNVISEQGRLLWHHPQGALSRLEACRAPLEPERSCAPASQPLPFPSKTQALLKNVLAVSIVIFAVLLLWWPRLNASLL